MTTPTSTEKRRARAGIKFSSQASEITCDVGMPMKEPSLVIDFSQSVTPTSSRSASAGSPSMYRDKHKEVLKRKKEFFETCCGAEPDSPTRAMPSHVRCSHFGAAAAALGYLLGSGDAVPTTDSVTLEQIFYGTKQPLHHATNGNITLGELHDVIATFMENDLRFRGRYIVDKEVFDIKPQHVDLQGTSDFGARTPSISLAQLRTQLSQEAISFDSVKILCFDPQTAESGLLIVDDEDETEAYETLLHTAIVSPSVKKLKSSALRSSTNRARGACSVVVDYNQVNHIVQLYSPAFSPDGKLSGAIVDVPLSSVYSAMCAKTAFTCRAGGYLTIRSVNQPPATPSAGLRSPIMTISAIPCMFAPQLLEGEVVDPAAVTLNQVNPKVATHLTAFAFALSLMQGVHPNGTIRGVDLNTIVNALQLPVDVVMRSNLSLQQVYAYAKAFLELSPRCENELGISINPILRKVQRAGAPVTLSVTDFEKILEQCVAVAANSSKPDCVLILQFDVNLAMNAIELNFPDTNAKTWGVFAGYDSKNQVALIADMFPRKFSSKIAVPVEQLHSAITDCGYLCLYRKDVPGTNIEVPLENLVEKFIADIPAYRRMSSKLHGLVPRIRNVLSVAVHALQALGVTEASLQGILASAQFSVSFYAADAIALNDYAFCVRSYLEHINSPINVSVHFLEYAQSKAKKMHVHTYILELRECLQNGRQVIVNFSRGILNSAPPIGDVTYGDYAVVLEFVDDEHVLIMDATVESYNSVWTVNVSDLFTASQDICPLSRRAHGFIILSPGGAQTTNCRELAKFAAPSSHPFKVWCPALRAAAVALSSINTRKVSTESIFYAYVANSELADLPLVKDLGRALSGTLLQRMLDAFFVHQPEYAKFQAKFLTGSPTDMEDILRRVTSAGDTQRAIVLYRASVAHDVIQNEIGAAVVRAYDAASQEVHLIDSESARWGKAWSCALTTLSKALASDQANTTQGLLLVTKE